MDHKKPKQKITVSEVMKKSIVLAVSVALLIFAFLPVFSVNFTMEFNTGEKVKKFEPSLSLSAIDNVVLFFDAIQSLDSDELENSDLTGDMLDLIDEIKSDVYGIYQMDKQERDEVSKKISKFLLMTVRLSLQHEDVHVKATMIAGAIISLIYILAAVALFILALIDLICYTLRKSIKKLWNISVTLLTLIPAIIVTLAASMALSYNFNYETFAGSGCESIGLSAIAVVALILSLSTVIYIIVDRIVHSKFDRPRVSEIIRRSFVFALAIVMIAAAFAPALSMDVKTVFDGKERQSRASQSVYPSFFNTFSVDQDEINEYEDAEGTEIKQRIASSFLDYQMYTSKEFSRGMCSSTTSSLLKDSFMGFGGAGFAPYIAILPIALLMVVIVATVLMWLNLRALATGSSPLGAITIPMKILGILCALVVMAIVIIVMLVCNINMGNILFRNGYPAVKIGAGSILAVIGSVAITCIPMKKSKKIEQ